MVVRLGRVLSQSEIDGLLSQMLDNASVIPCAAAESNVDSVCPVSSPPKVGVSCSDSVPAGIAAFKAKIEAAKAAQAASESE